jgi:PAS domain S-box-containing protein
LRNFTSFDCKALQLYLCLNIGVRYRTGSMIKSKKIPNLESADDRKDRLLLYILSIHLLVIYGWTFITRQYDSILLCSLIFVAAFIGYYYRPGSFSSRFVITLSFIACSSSLIHLSHGLVEMNFHIFAMLALLATYYDWKIILLATVIITFHHLMGLLNFGTYTGYAFTSNPGIYLIHILFVFLTCLTLCYLILVQRSSFKVINQQNAALLESENYYRALAQNFPGGLVTLFDTNLRFIIYNGNILKKLGTSPEKYEGKTLQESLPLELSAVFEPYYRKALGGEVSHFDFIPQGIDEVFEVQVLPVKDIDGRTFAGMSVFQDITTHRRLEEELRQTVERERELSELKSRFITTTSHEFRTPLTGIISNAELLEIYSHRFSEEKKLELVKRIQNSGKYLARLLDDILIVEKAEEDGLDFFPRELDLTTICQAILQDFQVDLPEKHSISFRVNGSIRPTYADERLLQFIFINLLNNAIKYSPEGGKIELVVTYQEQNVLIQVKDKGISIPAGDQLKIFDNFYRATNTGTIPGTGLGLTIVKKSVELHQGTIQVESQVGLGTTFTISLPDQDISTK